VIKPTDLYETPPELFEALNMVFDFDVDAAAALCTAKCFHWFGPEHLMEEQHNALTWEGNWTDLDPDGFATSVWCNPPYSQPNLERFARRCRDEARKGAIVVMLCPHSPETGWWREYVLQACEVWEVFPRVQFLLDGERKPGNPWASAVVVWTPFSSGPPARRSWTWKEATA